MNRGTAIALAGALLLALPAAAEANKGVAVDLGRIQIRDKLQQGGSYRLPVIGVRNPGTERTDYAMTVEAISGKQSPPGAWFSFSPRRFALAPGQTRPVRVRLSIPSGARPAGYEALVGAAIVTPGKGAQLGAVAAARVDFTVEASSTLEAWWLQVKAFYSDQRPWTYLVPALLLAALLLGLLRRRFSLRLERRP